MTDVLDSSFQRLLEKFSSGEARYIMRCLTEDMFDNHFNKDSHQDVLSKAVNEILNDKPLQYVTGVAWFFKLKFHVNEHVLIPRPETEELVEWVMECFDERPLKMLDVGTGSGCIAVALKRMRSDWTVQACDVSETALVVAEKNANANNATVEFFQMDITQPNDSTVYDLIVSNPPYIALEEKQTLAVNVVSFEPHFALFAPPNEPLFFYEALIRFALNNLTPDGSVFVEINQSKSEETFVLFTSYFRFVEMRKDMSGNFRMLYASGLKQESLPR